METSVVEDLIHGGNSLVQAANIRTSTERMNRHIVRLIPLEMSAQDNKNNACSDSNSLSCRCKSAASMSDSQVDVSIGVVESHPVRSSAKKAQEKLTLFQPLKEVMNS